MKLRSSVYGWKSVWMEFADEHQGSFDDGQKVFVMRVPVQGKPWNITFHMQQKGVGGAVTDSSAAFLPFKAKGPFSFDLHNRSLVGDASKIFGAQDIQIGEDEFDREYIIKGSDENAVKRIFGSQRIQELIKLQPHIKLYIQDEPKELAEHGTVPPGIHVLAFRDKAAINSYERLTLVHDLMLATLDEMMTNDLASPQDPNFDI
jgi:hypothetical protein